MRQALISDFCNHLGAMNLSLEETEENWTAFQYAVHSSATTTLGHPSRKHQECFDESDESLLEEKHRLHKAHQGDTSSVSKKAAYSNICKTVQNKLSDTWLSKKAKEIQSFADRNDMKKFHDALKPVNGP